MQATPKINNFYIEYLYQITVALYNEDVPEADNYSSDIELLSRVNIPLNKNVVSKLYEAKLISRGVSYDILDKMMGKVLTEKGITNFAKRAKAIGYYPAKQEFLNVRDVQTSK